MSVLGVHGISKIAYFRRAGEDPAAAADAMGVDWTAWIDRGVAKYTPTRQPPGAVSIGYYADCLAGDVAMGPEDPEHLGSLGQELFVTWVEEISRERFGAEQFSQNAAHKWAVGKPAAFVVNHYGEQLCGILSRLSGDLASYFGPDHGERRENARRRVAEAIRRHRPRTLLAHSLGSVVVYEALCADSDLGKGIELLVTLGSPLGVPRVVFERLDPKPGARGIRPPGVGTWVNLAEIGDPVALPAGRLTERFDGLDEDIQVSLNVANPHSVKNYLGCRKFAEVLQTYLP